MSITTQEDVEWEHVDSCWGFYGKVYAGAYDPRFYIDQDAKTFAAGAIGANI